MKKIIPFSGKLSKQKTQAWVAVLQENLPQHSVIDLDDLSSKEKSNVDVVVVANPDIAKLAELKNLKWVHSVWAGVESIISSDLNREISISRLVDPNLAQAMAEAALTATLFIHRDMPLYLVQQSKSNWQQHSVKLAQQRRVGILGLGELGMHVANRLSLNGFKVSGWSRQKKNCKDLKITSLYGHDGLENLLKQSEILIILLPLTDQTKGLIDHKTLSLMPQGASIINLARGPIINEQDLLAQIESRHINHAVLDVFGQEPLPKQHPFWMHPNITVWPHIAAPTNQHSAAKIVANNIQTYFDKGTMANVVDRNQQY